MLWPLALVLVRTFILRLISQEISNAVYLVFGAQNAKEAKDSFSVPASAFHSLRNQAVRTFVYARTRASIRTESQNVHVVIDGLFGRNHDIVRNVIASIVSKAKLENLKPDATDDMLRNIMNLYDD